MYLCVHCIYIHLNIRATRRTTIGARTRNTSGKGPSEKKASATSGSSGSAYMPVGLYMRLPSPIVYVCGIKGGGSVGGGIFPMGVQSYCNRVSFAGGVGQ